MAIEREGGDEGGPGDGVGFAPLGHFVEHPAGVVGAAAFAVGVDESGDGEAVGEEAAQGEVGVRLLGGAEASEGGAGLEEGREGEAVGKESWKELLVEGEGILGILTGFLGDLRIPAKERLFLGATVGAMMKLTMH